MNALGDQQLQRIIYEAMPRNPRQPLKARAHDAHVEVTSFASAGMTGVQMAVVTHLDGRGL